MRVLLIASLLLASLCTRAAVVSVEPAPAVSWDGGPDRSERACAVLAAALCPVAADASMCAEALRNDQAQGIASQIDEGCIIEAGPSLPALQVCGVTCK